MRNIVFYIKKISKLGKVQKLIIILLLVMLCWSFFTLSSLRCIKDINKYFNKVNKANYVVFIAAADECSLQFGYFAKSFSKLGFKSDLHGKFQWGFIGIIDGGQVVYEDLQDAPLTYKYIVNKSSFNIVSEGWGKGNKALIKNSNDYNYSLNRRGLNIVVYDKRVKQVIDSVVFDTYAYPIECTRGQNNMFILILTTMCIAFLLCINKDYCCIKQLRKIFKEYLIEVPFLLISFVFILYILKNVFLLMQLFHFDILIVTITVVLHIIGTVYLFYRDSKRKDILISLIICYIVIIGAAFISAGLYDFSWDGQAYHQEAVIALRDGWNPFYERKPNIVYEHNVFLFPHFFEIYASIISSIFGTIEAGKSLHLVFIITLFLYSIKIVNRYQKNLIVILCLSFSIIANPVVLAQMFTYYIDGTMGIVLILQIFALMDFELEKKYKYLFLVVALSVFMINLKFTGFICWCPIIGYILINIVHKRLKNALVLITTGIIVLLVAVLFLGYNPYMKNFLDKGNFLYPLYGKDNIAAEMFKGEIFYSKQGFCKTLFLLERGTLPFSSSKLGFKNESAGFDMRIGGFGVFFIEICIFALGAFVLTLFIDKKKAYKEIIVPIVSLTICSLFVPHNWWARYIPYFWYVPCLLFIPINLERLRIIMIVAVTAVTVYINSISFTVEAIIEGLNYKKECIKFFSEIQKSEAKNIIIVIHNNCFIPSIKDKMLRLHVNKNTEFTLQKNPSMYLAPGRLWIIKGWYEQV
ncbi:MAG: hypothetical protein LBD57_05835 [Endomicrobium sp.]|jgi:hypothetical protein|uniref:hypothetical protein n=1 Tax=Candidatus Endomicrobiellum cubanum TaxID=3242325 RepID=UPI00282F7507|nr:hypothetical protein [Endomicrobium sp.]